LLVNARPSVYLAEKFLPSQDDHYTIHRFRPSCKVVIVFNLVKSDFRPMMSFALVAQLVFCLQAQAGPILHCAVTYAGATSQIDTRMVHDANVGPSSDTGGAYSKESVDIGGRFRFKAVMLGQGTQLDVVKLYAYYETRSQPILLQEVKYFAPFKFSSEPYSLTGHNYLYSPPLGRELQYGCNLVDEKS
jgi:hypothetical protein